MSADVTLYPGSRGFICGASGSGKTTFALELVLGMQGPRVIVNTKHDPGIDKFCETWGWEVVDYLPDWGSIEEDVCVRPDPSLLVNDGELIDKWLGGALHAKYVLSIYLDEGYQVGAKSNKKGEGVTRLWTLSRAKGFTCLLGSQRPAWLSLFVLTESDRYYIGRLALDDDRKRMAEVTGDPRVLQIQQPKHFWYCVPGRPSISLAPIAISEPEVLDTDDEDDDNGVITPGRRSWPLV